MAQVRLGSIGLGWWGGVLATAVGATGEAEVVACFARTAASRAAFAESHGCEAVDALGDLLSDPTVDGVLVATPHTTHAALAIEAARAGKHVFVDKPLTLTVAEADEVIAAADAAGVVLQVGHNRRRQEANRRIKAMIDDGSLGELHHLEANHSAPLLFNPNLAAWRRDPVETPVGGMTALGVHQVDTLQYFAGPIATVSVFSTRLLPTGDVDDTSAIQFAFESGALGQLMTSQATGPRVDVAVHGTKASAWNLRDGATLEVQRRGSQEVETLPVGSLDTIAEELAEFAAAIRGETTPETGGSEGRSVVAVLEAIVESAQSGTTVSVHRS